VLSVAALVMPYPVVVACGAAFGAARTGAISLLSVLSALAGGLSLRYGRLKVLFTAASCCLSAAAVYALAVM
jgi:hypothetical protein